MANNIAKVEVDNAGHAYSIISILAMQHHLHLAIYVCSIPSPPWPVSPPALWSAVAQLHLHFSQHDLHLGAWLEESDYRKRQCLENGADVRTCWVGIHSSSYGSGI